MIELKLLVFLSYIEKTLLLGFVLLLLKWKQIAVKETYQLLRNVLIYRFIGLGGVAFLYGEADGLTVQGSCSLTLMHITPEAKSS